MSEVEVICPICQKTHTMIGMDWVDTEETKHVWAMGDPFCSDKCREASKKIPSAVQRSTPKESKIK